ncbi:MAG TPA: squalene/phytoene synthase family protein [Oscillatoriales cyanobacterium M59_W2019_021]|nr:squalene/phytoene synthase family protein [Oscillatoriales cyanobacterium M4454_W2019_049]HIK51392.1 squalene/phytoene synthase family protein [Oscillatoriales cyanobacterium M59_W2019_021]
MAVESFRISQWVESSRCRALGDDALKDEDNAAWVMQLESAVRQEWIERIRWIRLADRLAENELIDRSSLKFRGFCRDWQHLRDRREVPPGCEYDSVWRAIASRWFERRDDGASEDSIAIWNAYLEALRAYHHDRLILERLADYEDMLANLAGHFFQILPFLDPKDRSAARDFGIVDQFYNNLRDLAEDSQQGICYFPTEILERFGVERWEILQFECFHNPGYFRLIEFWLDEYLPTLRQRAETLLRSPRLHPSWQILCDWSVGRYHRIERIFRHLRFDYARFPRVYWAAVRRDLGYWRARQLP